MLRDVAAQAKLDEVVPCVVLGDIKCMHVAEIDLQIHWHCQFDSKVPAAKDMPKVKDGKVRVLMDAVACFQQGEVNHTDAQTGGIYFDTSKDICHITVNTSSIIGIILEQLHTKGVFPNCFL